MGHLALCCSIVLCCLGTGGSVGKNVNKVATYVPGGTDRILADGDSLRGSYKKRRETARRRKLRSSGAWPSATALSVETAVERRDSVDDAELDEREKELQTLYDPLRQWKGKFADENIIVLAGRLVDNKRKAMRDLIEYLGIPIYYLEEDVSAAKNKDTATLLKESFVAAAFRGAHRGTTPSNEDSASSSSVSLPAVSDGTERREPEVQGETAERQTRVLILGGDGTLGWAFEFLDKVFENTGYLPLVGVIPCGTYNDVARLSGWGRSVDNLEDLFPFVQGVVDAERAYDLDVWGIDFGGVSHDKNLHNRYMVHSLNLGYLARSLCDFEDWRASHPEASQVFRKVFIWLSGVKKLFENDDITDLIRLDVELEDGQKFHGWNLTAPSSSSSNSSNSIQAGEHSGELGGGREASEGTDTDEMKARFSVLTFLNIPDYGAAHFLPRGEKCDSCMTDGLLDVSCHDKSEIFNQLILNVPGKTDFPRVRKLKVNVPEGLRMHWMVDGTAGSGVGGCVSVDLKGRLRILVGPSIPVEGVGVEGGSAVEGPSQTVGFRPKRFAPFLSKAEFRPLSRFVQGGSSSWSFGRGGKGLSFPRWRRRRPSQTSYHSEEVEVGQSGEGGGRRNETAEHELSDHGERSFAVCGSSAHQS